MNVDVNELLPPETVTEFTVAVRLLRDVLALRQCDHQPDTSGTVPHLRRMCSVLEQVLGRAQYRAVGRLLLERRALFDLNKLYRPTKLCKQKQFEKERAHALGLWQDIVNMATMIAADDDGDQRFTASEDNS